MNLGRCHSTDDWRPLWWEGASTARFLVGGTCQCNRQPVGSCYRIQPTCPGSLGEGTLARIASANLLLGDLQGIFTRVAQKTTHGQNCLEQMVVRGIKSQEQVTDLFAALNSRHTKVGSSFVVKDTDGVLSDVPKKSSMNSQGESLKIMASWLQKSRLFHEPSWSHW